MEIYTVKPGKKGKAVRTKTYKVPAESRSAKNLKKLKEIGDKKFKKGLKTEWKHAKKQKSRLEGVGKRLSKVKFAKKQKIKKVLRKSDVVLKVAREIDVEPVLSDPNRFFKSKYEEDKRQFFFK